jgi:serine/threonine-protein kinase RsbW
MQTVRSGFELRAAADPESVPLVRHALRVYLERFDLSDDRIAEITLAVTEACSNVVVHAYRDDCVGDLEVIVEDEPGDGVIVRVRDRGTGLEPRADSPGLGVGLPVIHAIADSVEVHTVDDGHGTELRMHFR